MAMADTPPGRITDRMVADYVQRTTAAMRAQDVAGANRIATEAIELGVEHPFLFKVQALWLHNDGQYAEAIRVFHHARSLDPNDPMILNGIAGAMAASGAFAEALKLIETALEMAPNLVTTNYQHGWTLEALGRLGAAKAAYARTLELSPQHIPAMAGLANVAARLGDYDLARSNAVQVLSRAPGQPTAAVALATTEVATGEARNAEARLKSLLGSPIPPQVQAIAWGILGDALDALDRPAEAFEAYRHENEILQLQHAGRAAPGDRIEWELKDLAANLEPTAARWTAPRTAAGRADHVFLLGFMRSGTTLLEQALDSHPAVTSAEEADPLAGAAHEYLSDAGGIERLLAATDAELDPIRAQYWSALTDMGIKRDGKTVVDKMPLNTAKLPLIARLFPDARILFAIRDPRDVVLSCFRRHFEIRSLTYGFLSLEGAARLYDSTMAIGSWSQKHLPLTFHQVRYEKLVSDFEGELRSVCDVLGLPWDDAMRDFATHAAARDIRSQSAAQVRRGLYSDAVGHWYAYAEQMAPALPILEPWVKAFGYSG